MPMAWCKVIGKSLESVPDVYARLSYGDTVVVHQQPEAVAAGDNSDGEIGNSGTGDERTTVFEFASVATTGDRVTLAGYCPVSDDLEPCRWEILPADGKDAPQFRVVF
ncbi:hypothetical protein Rs2_35065 [Raphanus sativus]|nr:hypothetical protein Rs2_35065 [Raphanus sativus]